MSARKPAAKKVAKPETALVLRVCDSKLRSYGGFRWPKSGEVIAPDWDATPSCGKGLHGWLFGQGDAGCSNYVGNPDAQWMIVEVVLSEVVMLGGKCKFPRCTVRFVGDKKAATDYLRAHEPRSRVVAVIGASLVVGKGEACVVGAYGTATAGDSGTATAGYSGTATAGDSGTATAGAYGTATAGDRGELRIRWYDNKAERYRTEIAYVGEGGIKPNVPYRMDDKHKFVEVTP